MFTRIVVGTDGSETAGEAVRQAIDLAKLAGATLSIVSAFAPVSDARSKISSATRRPTSSTRSARARTSTWCSTAPPPTPAKTASRCRRTGRGRPRRGDPQRRRRDQGRPDRGRQQGDDRGPPLPPRQRPQQHLPSRSLLRNDRSYITAVRAPARRISASSVACVRSTRRSLRP